MIEQKATPALSEIRFAAMGLLAMREHSRQELVTKLSQRFDQINAVQNVIEGLIVDGLQSDSRFAEAFARMRYRQGKGTVRISLELRERGVNASDIENALYDDDFDWYESAVVVRQKKFGSLPSLPKEKMKQMRFLQYRGFTSDQIQHALQADVDNQ